MSVGTDDGVGSVLGEQGYTGWTIVLEGREVSIGPMTGEDLEILDEENAKWATREPEHPVWLSEGLLGGLVGPEGLNVPSEWKNPDAVAQGTKEWKDPDARAMAGDAAEPSPSPSNSDGTGDGTEKVPRDPEILERRLEETMKPSHGGHSGFEDIDPEDLRGFIEGARRFNEGTPLASGSGVEGPVEGGINDVAGFAGEMIDQLENNIFGLPVNEFLEGVRKNVVVDDIVRVVPEDGFGVVNSARALGGLYVAARHLSGGAEVPELDSHIEELNNMSGPEIVRGLQEGIAKLSTSVAGSLGDGNLSRDDMVGALVEFGHAYAEENPLPEPATVETAKIIVDTEGLINPDDRYVVEGLAYAERAIDQFAAKVEESYNSNREPGVFGQKFNSHSLDPLLGSKDPVEDSIRELNSRGAHSLLQEIEILREMERADGRLTDEPPVEKEAENLFKLQ